KKNKGKKWLKIGGGILLLLLLLASFVYWYINRIGQGTRAGSLPEAYQLVKANGYAFSVKISGQKSNPAVILLHGFPESSFMWKGLMADLNQRGYYTIAPDQRGYSFQARPSAVEEYQMSHLAADVMGLADALGIDQFHLIGHDWGAAVGWQVATDHPDRILSYTAMSVPHLDAFSKAYLEDSVQYAASSYIRDLQTWKFPEFILARQDYKMLASFWDQQPKEEIAAYKALFSQKGALTSAINWYRANYDLFNEGYTLGQTKVPVLFLWGKNDFALMRSGAEATEQYVSDYYRFVELAAGHWLIQEAYDRVQKEVLAHLERF
ncbi:MAG: alpha/beta hydrolase, partial [Bacteroidota bacterium]